MVINKCPLFLVFVGLKKFLWALKVNILHHEVIVLKIELGALVH